MATLTLEQINKIERDAVRRDTPVIARYLQDNLGQKITAYLSGVNDVKLVGKWASGKSEPRDLTKLRLRTAYQVARLIITAYGADTAKAWFFGTNSRLGDQAPARLLRQAESLDKIPNIVPVAKAFSTTAA